MEIFSTKFGIFLDENFPKKRKFSDWLKFTGGGTIARPPLPLPRRHYSTVAGGR